MPSHLRDGLRHANSLHPVHDLPSGARNLYANGPLLRAALRARAMRPLRMQNDLPDGIGLHDAVRARDDLHDGTIHRDPLRQTLRAGMRAGLRELNPAATAPLRRPIWGVFFVISSCIYENRR